MSSASPSLCSLRWVFQDAKFGQSLFLQVALSFPSRDAVVNFRDAGFPGCFGIQSPLKLKGSVVLLLVNLGRLLPPKRFQTGGALISSALVTGSLTGYFLLSWTKMPSQLARNSGKLVLLALSLRANAEDLRIHGPQIVNLRRDRDIAGLVGQAKGTVSQPGNRSRWDTKARAAASRRTDSAQQRSPSVRN